MKILKIFTNDIILFCINLVMLIIIWFNFIDFDSNYFIEILAIGLLYYLISLLSSFSIVFLLYLQVKDTFKKSSSFFYKFELISYIFGEYFDEIDTIKDFELKLKRFID